MYLYAPLPPQLTKVNDLYKYSIVNDFLVLEPRFDFMETKFYTQVYMRMCLNIYIDCLRWIWNIKSHLGGVYINEAFFFFWLSQNFRYEWKALCVMIILLLSFLILITQIWWKNKIIHKEILFSFFKTLTKFVNFPIFL